MVKPGLISAGGVIVATSSSLILGTSRNSAAWLVTSPNSFSTKSA